jgi:Pectate lyase superfamily protein
LVSWDIPSSHSVGDSGHTSDHNLVYSALNQIIDLLPTVYNVVYYGADPTGTVDSSSAFEAVQTAIGTNPGTVYIPAGTYKCSTFFSLVQNQNIIGDGSASVSISYTGTTTALTIGPSGSFNDADNAGVVAGFSLSAYGASGTPNGIQFGELQSLQLRDVALYGFAGTGLYGNNSAGWSEENNIQCSLVGCGKAVVFNGGSFDYGNYDFLIVTGPGQGGFILQGDAQMQGCSLRMRGNFYIASTNTAAVIAIDPTNTSGTSYISNSFIDVAVENAPATGATSGYVSHYTLYMGSASSASQFINCTGVLSFANVATTSGDAVIEFQGYYNPNNVPVGFSGVINDSVLGLMTQGDGLAIMGGTDYVVQDSTSDGLYLNTLYLQFGDIQPFLLNSGTNTISFQGITSGTGGFGKRITVLAKQPSGGGATITWPSNVSMFSGTGAITPVTTANTVTQYELVFIPQDNRWYGRVVATGMTA